MAVRDCGGKTALGGGTGDKTGSTSGGVIGGGVDG